MKKTMKAILKMGLVVTVVGVVMDFCQESKKQKQQRKAERERSDKAFSEFLVCNKLERKDITYVNDSKYPPVYTYNADKFQPEKAQIPQGYVLRKWSNTTYAYGLKSAELLQPLYGILFWLEDERERYEWNDSDLD